jgi:alkylation response protein AidB-like acyl-CoA dehydrogenase
MQEIDMDFDFSDDQESLRDAVRKWVDKGYDFERRRKAVKAGGFDRAAYRELADLGLTGLYVAEDQGGMGMGPIEGMVVMEELGRGIVLEPLAQTLIASGLLSGYAPEALKTAWLPKIAGGEALVVLAYVERKARYRLDVCETAATQAGAQWKVSGAKSIVAAGDHADALLVPATVNGKMAMFLVERTAAGVTTRGYGTQDGSRAAEVTFKDSPATLVTLDGLAALEHGVDIGIAATCAEGVGVIDKTMQVTAEYMNTRKQFGVTLATFQALRHRMADMKMQQELLRLAQAQCAGAGTAPCHGPRQVPAGGGDALRRPAVGAAARRHRCDRRIHRQPLLQEADPAGTELRGYPAPAGRSVGKNAGHRRRVCVSDVSLRA